MIEDCLISEFDALNLADQTPTALLSIVHRLFPKEAELTPETSKSWRSVIGASHALRLRSLAEDDGEAYGRRADLGICLESAVEIILARKGKTRRSKSLQDDISFCRYCWRLGNTHRERRGYNDNAKKITGSGWNFSHKMSRDGQSEEAAQESRSFDFNLPPLRRADTHAYCSIHKPSSQKITRKYPQQQSRIIRKVLNQKIIQKARKISRFARRIERCVISKDKMLSLGAGVTRAWMAGDFTITHQLDDQWPVLVSLFFPYIAANSTWSAACLSPLEAFKYLEAENIYDGQEVLHKELATDPSRLAFYIMPMMLRLDVWLEVELMVANRKRKKKLTGFVRKPWPSSFSILDSFGFDVLTGTDERGLPAHLTPI